MNLRQQKNELRTQATEIRNSLNIANISKEVISNLKQLAFYREAKNIFTFYPFRNELNITTLFEDTTKNWFLPRVFLDDMEICPYKQGDKLKENTWGILEPTTTNIKAYECIDFVIVPALMADLRGFRLGYGKGFYDKFLALYKGKSCILIPDELLKEGLPNEKFDKPCNFIVTQSRVIICNHIF